MHHLEKSVRNGIFDLDREKELLRSTNLIVWQFPLYWVQLPASLRDWQDQVLSPIVYGSDNFLKDKFVQIAFTAGSVNRRSRICQGYHRLHAHGDARPLQMTVNIPGMQLPAAVRRFRGAEYHCG